MSMTQMAFIDKAKLPTNKKLEETILGLGFEFRILNNADEEISQDGLECIINGCKTYFETYVEPVNDILNEEWADWIKTDITNQDTCVSFIWGADFAAGACIGLISIALIDLSDALIYYLDDEMKYTREMLVSDTPQFLEELNKQKNNSISQSKTNNSNQAQFKKDSFLIRLKKLFR